jgi:hypothetical protein
MSQESINQRIKFLLENYKLSVRAFSELIGQKPANTQNYVGTRGSMPGADYLQSITEHFEEVNPAWLLNGKGKPFLTDAPALTQTNISGKKNAVNVASSNGKTIQKNYELSDCEKEIDLLKAQLDKAQREIELLTGQLKMQETIIQSKDQMLDLLRSGFARPS